MGTLQIIGIYGLCNGKTGECERISFWKQVRDALLDPKRALINMVGDLNMTDAPDDYFKLDGQAMDMVPPSRRQHETFQEVLKQGQLIRAENDIHTFRDSTHTSNLDRAYFSIHPGNIFRMDVYCVPVPTSSKNTTHNTWHYPLAFGTFLHRAKGVRLPDWIAKHPDFNGLVTEEMQAIKK